MGKGWCVGKDMVLFRGIVRFWKGWWGMAVLGTTGGASKASDKCSFAKISVNNKDWCNGRSELYSVIT